jgi:hypothetical protein
VIDDVTLSQSTSHVNAGHKKGKLLKITKKNGSKGRNIANSSVEIGQKRVCKSAFFV